MSEYPSIDPADVREGDVVRAKYDKAQYPATIEGVVYESMNDDDDRLFVGGYVIRGATDLRLVSRPAPPEPPLRVGDFMRWAMYDIETQMFTGSMARYYDKAGGVRIEPPVGWPVAVPDPDAPGGARWYVKVRDSGDYYLLGGETVGTPWPNLVRLGGIPALAPGGAA